MTGIRGIAAVFVMVYHLRIYALFSGGLAVALRHGYLSVDMFFVLSGFVMALSYGEKFRRGATAGSYGRFLSNRIARIYPLYASLTLLLFLWHGFGKHPIAKTTFLQNMLLIQTWGPGHYVIPPAWSLSAEMAAYVVFPILALLCLATNRLGAGLFAAVGVGLLSLLALLPSTVLHVVRYRGPLDIPDGSTYGPIMRCLVEFSFGMLAWRVSKSERLASILESSWPSALVFLGILALMPLPNGDLAIVLLFPVLVCLLSPDQSLLARALSSPVMMWLGNISFSIFLLHLIIPIYREPTEALLTKHHVVYPQFVWASTIFVITLGLGTLTYEWVEKPGRTLLRNAFKRGFAVIRPA